MTSKAPGTDNRPGRLLAVVLAAQFMALLDVFIVNVAVPTIGSELHASGAGLQLVVAGYTIAYAVLLITGARLGDRLGHRRVYLAGLALFTAASLACGLAQGTGELIAFRLVQGAGSAVMIPQVLSLIQRNFSGEARARALGAYAAVLATGAAAGQVLGGVLVSADLFGTSWRPVFLVNVPVGVVLLAVGRRILPRDDARALERSRGLDLPGLVLLAAAVSLFTVPLVLGQEEDWPLWSWLSLGAAAVCFGLFCLYESRLARRGGAPLIAPRVLRQPGVGLAVFRLLAVMAVNSRLPFHTHTAHTGRSRLQRAARGAHLRTDRCGLRPGRSDLAQLARVLAAQPDSGRLRARGDLRGRCRTCAAGRGRRRPVAVRGVRGAGRGPRARFQSHPHQGPGHRPCRGRGGRQRAARDGHPARSADRCRGLRHTLLEPA